MGETPPTPSGRRSVDLRAGAGGLLAVALTLFVLAAAGRGGVTAAVAALIVSAVRPPGEGVARVRAFAAVTLIGAALTAVGVWAGEEGWVAALLMTGVTFSATLTAAYGRTWATAGYLLNLWVLLALILSASDHSVALMAGAFLIGGALAGAVGLLPLGRRAADGSAGTPQRDGLGAEANEPAGGTGSGRLRDALSPDSPLFRFGLVRALAAGSATLIGWYLFDAHPYWAALTAFVIIQTEPERSVRRGIERTVGTAFGVLVGIAIVQLVEGTWPLVAIFAISAFLMMAVQEVSYALFSFFVTIVLLDVSRIATQDVPTAGLQRLEATALGAGLAFVAIWLGTRLAARRSRRGGTPAR